MITNSIALLVASLAVCKAQMPQVYGQCGGVGYAGARFCPASSYCLYQNEYWSSCWPNGQALPPGVAVNSGQGQVNSAQPTQAFTTLYSIISGGATTVVVLPSPKSTSTRPPPVTTLTLTPDQPFRKAAMATSLPEQARPVAVEVLVEE
ncbi:hypothetical protein GQ53DRAFT_842214 [Thozetella sp. PMI_491]|nr:hypothetical protein GQ53DRAFT_842214 [Thozetella sp. PMI_491]